MDDLQRVREIYDLNFEESFPFVKETVEAATFLAFDAEFTGIASADVKQNSLFDSPKERYATMRSNVKDFIISQFGLTAFQFDREGNKYSATSFVFYLFPRSVGTLHRTFNVETSAFQFLAQYGFDFGMFLGRGVTYLSRSDEAAVSVERPLLASAMRSRRNGPLGRFTPPLTRAERCLLDDELGLLAGWLAKGRGQAIPLEGTLRSANPRLMNRLAHIVRKAFRGVAIHTTRDELTGQWSNVYNDLGADPAPFRERLAHEKAGFTRVFRLLSDVQKPMVGHNAILDLMLMYHQFHAPLPTDYLTLKREIHELFPHVFDTKFLSYELRDRITRDSRWAGNDLAKLYSYFESGIGSYLAKFSPLVELVGMTPEPINTFHEAGWDSFCTGFCFVRMMHFFATQNNRECGMDAKPLTSVQHLVSVQPFKNRINISRANINNINLAGSDPVSKKPQWLVVELLDRDALADSKLTELVVRHTDLSLEVKQLSTYQALIAVNSITVARQLMQSFAGKTEFHVSEYSALSHDPVMRTCLWASILSSAGVVATLLFVIGRRC